MSKIILMGRSGTGSSVCEALLELTGQSYEFKTFKKLADGSSPPEIFAINPLGQVPALITQDGVLMTESAAIALWICDNAPESGLAPALNDPRRAHYLRAMFFMAANSYMSALRYFYPDRYSSDPKDAPKVQAKAREHLDREWAVLTQMLGDQDYLTGHTMCAADIYLSMLISWDEERNAFAEKFPRLEALNARVIANETVAAVWARNDYKV